MKIISILLVIFGLILISEKSNALCPKDYIVYPRENKINRNSLIMIEGILQTNRDFIK